MKKVVKDVTKEVAAKELFDAILLLNDREDLIRFFKDLCTPREIKSLVERWRVCRLLNQGEFSYREISEMTGASLVTIGRVARFLNIEPHSGYRLVLGKMAKERKT